MKKTQYIEVDNTSKTAIDANTSQAQSGNAGRYFSATNTDTLHQGRISVTHTSCVDGTRGDSGELTYELNRRQTCPRASKLSLHSASLQLSQHAAASKKKKWLLLSQWLQSQHSTSSNTFAGRPSRFAPQNPTALSRNPISLKFDVSDSQSTVLLRAALHVLRPCALQEALSC